MAMLTIEEAAKKSGKDARDLRRLLRNGTLKGAKKEGSWTVDSNSLAGLGKADGKGAKAAKPAKSAKAAKAEKPAKKSKKAAAPAADEWDADEPEE